MVDIAIDGKVWPSTEHYFQAMKFPGNPAHQERIRTTPKCGSVFKLGRMRVGLRADWLEVKDNIMFEALKVKFAHKNNPELCEKLLSTGDAQIVEHTKRDKYWGDGGDGGTGKIGRNTLGKLLMKLRDEVLKPQIKD